MVRSQPWNPDITPMIAIEIALRNILANCAGGRCFAGNRSFSRSGFHFPLRVSSVALRKISYLYSFAVRNKGRMGQIHMEALDSWYLWIWCSSLYFKAKGMRRYFFRRGRYWIGLTHRRNLLVDLPIIKSVPLAFDFSLSTKVPTPSNTEPRPLVSSRMLEFTRYKQGMMEWEYHQ